MFLREEEDLYANLLPTGDFNLLISFPLKSLINNCSFLMGKSAVPAGHCIQDLYVPKKSAEAGVGRTQLWKLLQCRDKRSTYHKCSKAKANFPQKIVLQEVFISHHERIHFQQACSDQNDHSSVSV